MELNLIEFMMNWNGALWLYRATGDQKYLDKFKSVAIGDKKYNSCETPINWDEKYGGVFVLAAQLLEEDRYLDRAHKFADAILGNQRTPVGLYFYLSLSRWGSNKHASNAASNLLLFFPNFLPDSDERKQTYIDFAESQMNYILGDNHKI